MFSKIFKIISNTVLVLVLAVGLLVALSFVKVPGGIKLFTVMSGSMEPALHTGSVIFDKSSGDYNVGDIVTRTTDDPKVTITHRVVSKETVGGQTMFQTKGDANNIADQGEFPQNAIIGREFLTIPYVGYVVAFAKTQQGIIILIIIPAIIIIYDELNKIKKEVQLMFGRKRKTEAAPAEEAQATVFERKNSLEERPFRPPRKNKIV